MSAAVIEPLGKKLLQDVAASDLSAIEKTLSGRGNMSTLQQAISFSIPISSVMDTILRGQSLVHKLMGYDINSISAFHLAALQGHNEIIVVMLDKLGKHSSTQDVGVDMCLESDSTALQLAAFGGRTDTVKLLLDVYKAQVNRQDKYGWTALHYASTEGREAVVKMLVEHGADVDLRDKDGTSAAWRARINKHHSIVAYLCEHGDEEDLLNVENLDEEALRASLHVEEEVNVKDLYAKVNKQAKSSAPQTQNSTPHTLTQTQTQTLTQSSPAQVLTQRGRPQYEDVDSQMRPIPGYEWVNPQTRQIGTPPPPDINENIQKLDSVKPGMLRPKSVPGPTSPRAMSELGPPGSTRTLPTGFSHQGSDVRKSTIRRIIRHELEAVFSDYETPHNAVGAAGAAGAGEEIGDVARAGVGINTLRGIMREELDKYRREYLQEPGAGAAGGGGGGAGTLWEDNEDYESLYETLQSLPPAPPTPSQAPPLPPPRTAAAAASQPPAPRTPSIHATDAVTETENKNRSSVVSSIPASAPPAPPQPRTLVFAPESPPPQRQMTGMVMLSSPAPTSMALQYSMKRLATIIGNDWKKLAHALPIQSKPAECRKRVEDIERRYGSEEDRALGALTEWRINTGRDATVDDVIIALRKCSLHQLIGEVELVASEFTA